MSERRSAGTETLAARIRELRRQHGLTQVQLSLRAGLDPSFLSRLETGRIKRPTSRTIQKISSGLNLDNANTIRLFLLAGQPEDSHRPVNAAADAASLRTQTSTPGLTNAIVTPPENDVTEQVEQTDPSVAWLALWARSAFSLQDFVAARGALEAATITSTGGFAEFSALAGLAENLGDPSLAADLYARALGRAWELDRDDLRSIEVKQAYLKVLARVPGRDSRIADILIELEHMAEDGTPAGALALSTIVAHRTRPGATPEPRDLVRLALAYRRALERSVSNPIALHWLASDLYRYWRAGEIAIQLWHLIVWKDPLHSVAWSALLQALDEQSELSPGEVLALVENPDGASRCHRLNQLLGPPGATTTVLGEVVRILSAPAPVPEGWRNSSAGDPSVGTALVENLCSGGESPVIVNEIGGAQSR